jgi:hypothetical protein
MLFSTNQIILFIIGLIILYAVYQQYTYTEKLEDVNVKDQVARDILNFMKPNTEFKEYLDFIVKIPYNRSINILNPEVFYELRLLAKNKTINKNTIVKYLSDM